MWLMRAKRDLFVLRVKRKFYFKQVYKLQRKIAHTRGKGGKVSTSESSALPISCVMCAEMEAPGHSERRKSERPLRQGRRKGCPGAGVEGTPPWYSEYENGKK